MKDPLTDLVIYLAGDFGPGLPHSKLKSFIQHNGGTTVDKVGSTTTHIVCSKALSSAGSADLVSQIKSAAIIRKCKMVTYDWLEDSLQSKKKLAERTYLVDAKQRQREAKIEEGRLKLVKRHQEKERVMAQKAKMKKEEEAKRRERKVKERREGTILGKAVGSVVGAKVESEEGEKGEVNEDDGEQMLVDDEEVGEMQMDVDVKGVEVKRGRGRPRKVQIRDGEDNAVVTKVQEGTVVKRGGWTAEEGPA